jgi:ubiquinol-cytochrome c reductase cytochrome b subunit
MIMIFKNMLNLFNIKNMLSLFQSFFLYSGLPSNITINWNYGSLLGLILFIQIVTGISLGMHYTAHINMSYESMEYIMRNVQYGWLIRYLHANGASLFFLFVYLHIARGIYAGSYTYPRYYLWNIGVIIYFLMTATAFLGYVLPFGQMSIWGATVITNLVSAIPYIGQDLVITIWGGFSVGNATINRFYSLHYLLPFILFALVFLHLHALHEHGSNNPLSISSNQDKIYFHPYFTSKDFYYVILFIILFAFLVFYLPNYLGHPDNYIPANPLVTPLTIVPEWYLLAPYAILRIIPNKLLGVIGLLFSIIILFILPLQSPYALRTYSLRGLSRIFFWLFVGSYLILIICGALPISIEIVTLSSIATIYYFSYFLLIVPLIHLYDSYIISLDIH